MGYRRKRKRNKRRYAGSFLAISVIVCGILVYALYASSAGKWVKETYIDPVFSEFRGEDTTPTTQTPVTQAPVNQGNKEHTLSLSGFQVFAMQTGAYAGRENAEKMAADIKKQGGAGYIYQDDMYRVFAFAYGSESEANQVKEQLRSVGNMESSVYTLAVPKIDFKVTGDDNGYEKVNGAFQTYLDVKDKINTVAVQLDKKELTMEQAQGELEGLKKRLQDGLASIEKLGAKEEKLGRFAQVYQGTISQFDGLIGSDETIFSAGIKNIYVDMVCSYSAYVKSLTA